MADDSEEACLVNPKSSSSGLQYTEGAIPSSVNNNQSSRRCESSPSSHQNNSSNSTSDQYDINDEIILSQFHADAIKQVCKHCRRSIFFIFFKNFVK